MAKCPAITRGGVPCRGLVREGNDYCPAHDPCRHEARARAAKRAGKSKASALTTELRELRDQLAELYESVLDAGIKPGVGAVAAQIANARIRLVESERRLKENEELEKRIEDLEGLLRRYEREGYGRGARDHRGA